MTCLSLLPLLISAALAEPALDVVNPHEDPQGCASCHEGEGPEPGPVLPIDETCKSCHEESDMHPVALAPKNVAVPDGWPLDEGIVSCWTCHTEPACAAGEPAEAPLYLRGGAFGRINDFCYRCHERQAYVREDPHHPMERRSADDSTCAACHVGLPEPGAAPEASKIREVEGGVCSTCHEPDTHLGTRSHMHERVEPGPRGRMPEAVALPADGTVQCWSCHEVHDETPMPSRRWHRGHDLAQALRADAREEWQLEDVERWPCDESGEHPPMLALPLEDGSLCHACHAEGGTHP
jgi:hypothetical protein